MAEPLSVAVVLSEPSDNYKTLLISLENNLADNIKLKFSDGKEPIYDANLIVAVGERAANALPLSTSAPVLYVLLPKSRYETQVKMRKLSGGGQRSVVYLEQPVERQLHLVVSILPQYKRLGFLSSASTQNELGQLSRKSSVYNLKINSAEVSEQVNLFDALRGVLENSDVLLALPDSTIYNSSTIRNILLASYRSGKPLIGFSAGFVNAGAIAAVFTTPEQLGTQIAAMIMRFGQTGTLPSPQYPKYFHVTVNKVVASSLGLSLKDADTIEKEMERKENDDQ